MQQQSIRRLVLVPPYSVFCSISFRCGGLSIERNQKSLTPENTLAVTHHDKQKQVEVKRSSRANPHEIRLFSGCPYYFTLPPLIDLAGVDQHLAVKHQHLVRWSDIKGSSIIVRVVFQAHLISSLIRQMYFSASVKISVTCFLRFGLVSRLGLKVKLYSSRWIMA